MPRNRSARGGRKQQHHSAPSKRNKEGRVKKYSADAGYKAYNSDGGLLMNHCLLHVCTRPSLPYEGGGGGASGGGAGDSSGDGLLVTVVCV